MSREVHVQFCRGRWCNSTGLLCPGQALPPISIPRSRAFNCFAVEVFFTTRRSGSSESISRTSGARLRERDLQLFRRRASHVPPALTVWSAWSRFQCGQFSAGRNPSPARVRKGNLCRAVHRGGRRIFLMGMYPLLGEAGCRLFCRSRWHLHFGQALRGPSKVACIRRNFDRDSNMNMESSSV